MPFVSFLIASLVAVCAALFGFALIRKLVNDRDAAYQFGVSGLVGLAAIGTLSYFAGIAAIIAAQAVAVVCLLFGAASVFKTKPVLKFAFSPLALLVSIPLILALVGAITPSTSLDWDSLAYHLAVPKIWESDGRISSISFIHHSNFPAAVDTWFLLAGNQYAAKSFTLWFTVFGCIALFGLARENTKQSWLPWLLTFAFASVPMVIWESGTAYIDVAHGLFAGLGFLAAARFTLSANRNDLWLGAILLAGAASTKYTGLQAIIIASIGLLVVSRNFKASLALGAAAFLLASPWYIKNFAMTGSPVYPFFFSVFGGKNWDAFQAMIYTEEQKTFGMQGAMNLGNSLFGLVSAPGRFTNPFPTEGTGFAWVSLGFAVIAVGVAGLLQGTKDKSRSYLAFVIGIQLLAWFALSQQSRYITVLLVPFLVLAIPVFESKLLKPILVFAVAVQGLASMWLIKDSVVAERLPVLIGAITESEFLGGYALEGGGGVPGKVAVYSASQALNENPEVTKVALFDEVFGYYLKKPYIWANPGHTTELGYAEMNSADDLVASLKKFGVSHVYLTNTFLQGKPELELFEGVANKTKPYSATERAERMKDQRSKWRVLLAEAIADGKIVEDKRFSRLRAIYRVL